MVPWTLELAVGEADQHASRVADPGKTGTETRTRRRGRGRAHTQRAPGNPSPAASASRCLARWPSRARLSSRPHAARSPARPLLPRRSPPSPPPYRRPRPPPPPARRSAPSRSARCSGRRSPRLRRPSRPPPPRWPRHLLGPC